MAAPEVDNRSAARRKKDEQIAEEPRLAPLNLPADVVASPVETHLGKRTPRPLAMVGIVEHGLVRPLDPAVELPEQSRVIIVASESGY